MNKFRNQLKKFGMEKEFSDWKEKILLEPREFRIGDKVKVIRAYEDSKYKIGLGKVGTVSNLGGRPHRILMSVAFDEYGDVWLFKDRFVKV